MLDPQIAAEIDELVEAFFGMSNFVWRNYISWLERGRPGMSQEDIESERLRYADIPDAEKLVRS